MWGKVQKSTEVGKARPGRAEQKEGMTRSGRKFSGSGRSTETAGKMAMGCTARAALGREEAAVEPAHRASHHDYGA